MDFQRAEANTSTGLWTMFDNMHNNTIENEISNRNSCNLTIFDTDRYREELSNQMAMTLLPVIAVLGIVLITGTVGNILVFYVYFFKFSPSSTRSAILALATFDLITCAVCIPGEILDLRFSYSFTSQVLCKGLRTVTTTLLIASGFTLVTVALDRYKRICHPLHQQLSSRRALIRVIGSCIVASILAAPAAVVYGLSKVKTPQQGVFGMECSTSQTSASRSLRIPYNVILCVVFLTAFFTMIIIYIFIGRQVLKQTHFRNSVQQRKGSSGSIRRHTMSSEKFSNGEHSVSDVAKDSSVLHETIQENNLSSNAKAVVNSK